MVLLLHSLVGGLASFYKGRVCCYSCVGQLGHEDLSQRHFPVSSYQVGTWISRSHKARMTVMRPYEVYIFPLVKGAHLITAHLKLALDPSMC